MQTFLPYPNFIKTAQCLDYKRLGKQRVEAKQILECLLGKSNLKWKNHPAVKMWKGYEELLAVYGYIICLEWRSRGYKDSLLDYFTEFLNKNKGKFFYSPYWLTKEQFHDSHKSNLLRKNPEYYSKFNWNVSKDLNYVWN